MTDTLGQLLWDATQRFGPQVALTQGDKSLTYSQLAQRAGKFANALSALGVQPGGRVASFVDDRVEALEVVVGCALGGFTLVPVNGRFRAAEATHVVHDSAASALVTTTTLADEAAAIDGLDELRAVVSIGDGEHVPRAQDYETLLTKARPLTAAEPRVTPRDVAVIGYTSGTTGFPKGALISHAAATIATRLVPFTQGMVSRGSCTFVGSFSFVSALWGILTPHLWTGSSLRILGATDVDEWTNAMALDRATYTWVPSPLVRQFTASLADRREVTDHLRTVVHTGSKVPADQLEALADVVGDRLVETWGLTETVGPLTSTTRSDFHGRCRASDLFSSVGRPVPTAQVGVLVDGEVSVNSDRTGELVARADTLFSGYLHSDHLDPESFVDGWFRTGDVGFVDPAGYVTISDRAKDVIVSGGMNVYPVEIELSLASLPGVRECAVIGAADDKWGETVVAIVAAEPAAALDEDAVVNHVRDRLAGYKKPTRVHFVDELPRNASMKVQKQLLRARYG